MKILTKHANEWIMIIVLILIGAYITYATTEKSHPEDAAAGTQVAGAILEDASHPVVVVIGTGKQTEFVAAAESALLAAGGKVTTAIGGPQEARTTLEKLQQEGSKVTHIACVKEVANWGLISNFRTNFPELASAGIVVPDSVNRSPFLERSNILNLADRTATIGIIAIGMTMIIITAGIDLSVGSLVALSAVISAWILEAKFGGTGATVTQMIMASGIAILVCGIFGFASGSLVTCVGVSPFIVTLVFMMVARGLAFIISKNESISETPESFGWLGQGKVMMMPIPALLMVILFVLFHILMTRTVLGRYIYAVGGNREAARLSGVPVSSVLLFVYTVTGILAGVVGIITASRFGTGKATFGDMMELDVIAAVVIGGTSLFGGEGRLTGTFIGSLLIVVIRNGMNLLGIKDNEQPVVLGIVILGAAIVDTIGKRRRGMV
ncbi:MAG: ABC transporter permease [Verrucomicrobiae bacterium]|nr:ABC transporter permease [Verrucomicrobiae bacterium]